MDVKLKGADGRNICQGLKSHYMTKEIPVILFSADQKVKEHYKECIIGAVMVNICIINILVAGAQI